MGGWRVIVIEGFTGEERGGRDVLYFREFLRLGGWKKLGALVILLGEFFAGLVLPSGMTMVGLLVIGGIAVAAGGRAEAVEAYVVGGMVAAWVVIFGLLARATVGDARWRVVHFEHVMMMLGVGIGIVGMLRFL